MTREIAIKNRHFAVLMTLVLPWGAMSASPGQAQPVPVPEVADPQPEPDERGQAIEQRPTTSQRLRADALAEESFQQQAQPAQPIAAEPASPPRPEGRIVRLAGNAAWTWYSDPRVLETAKRTYFGYVTNTGSVMLTSVDKADARVRTTTLSKDQLVDDHNVPALVETPDGRIAAFWGGHGRAPVQYRVSTTLGDVTRMSSVRTLKGSGIATDKATYVQAFRMRGVSNQYHILTRRYADQNWVITSSRDLVSWTPAVQLFKNSETVEKTWPYLEATSSGWRRMHFTVSDGHPAQDQNTSLFHFTYDVATQQLATSEGTPVSRPAFPRSGTLIYDGKSVDGRVRVYDLALRSDGQPAVAFTTQDRDPATPGYIYKWATRSGGTWSTRTLARQEAYPEGISLNSNDGDRAHIVTREAAGTQVSQVVTEDAGETWSSRPVSFLAEDQRTPVTPSGTGGPYSVLWMAGQYTNWRDYDTAILGETSGHTPIDLVSEWPLGWSRGKGVGATVTAGVDGPPVPGARVWLLARKPGESERRIRSALTNDQGAVHFPVNRYYPRGTTVRVSVPPDGHWGRATTSSVSTATDSNATTLSTVWPKGWDTGVGVRATATAVRDGAPRTATRVRLLVRKPGGTEFASSSAVTDNRGRVTLKVNRYYPKNTRVRVQVPRSGDWAAATSPARYTGR